MNLGSLLRRRRKLRQLTLKAVAESSGVSEGFLSQVENNVKSPSLATLMNLCKALETDPGRLLEEARAQESIFVVTKQEWAEVDLPHTGFATRRFVPPEERTGIDSALLFLEPGRSLPVRKGQGNGQEILCVLKGGLELKQGERQVLLKEGDAAHFFSQADQEVTNTGRGRAVVLWVGTT
jgi:transcriptional regulator with XRE-family HTH domain